MLLVNILSFFILIIVLLLIVKNSSSHNTERKVEKSTNVQRKLSINEATCTYFDARMEMYLKNLYGEKFIGWKYTESTIDAKYRRKKNFVTVTLSNGTTVKKNVLTDDVWGPRRINNENPLPENPLTPAQKWIASHAGDIETKIQNAIKNAEGIKLIYSVSSDISEDLLSEIAKKLMETSPYIIEVDEHNLIINYQALIPLDDL